jgi:hypothetical protein
MGPKIPHHFLTPCSYSPSLFFFFFWKGKKREKREG